MNWKILSHTYIIDLYNPAVRINYLVSHTTFVACVNFIHKWCDLHFKLDSEQHIFYYYYFFFEKLFMAVLFTLRAFARNLFRGSHKDILFVLYFDVWPGANTLPTTVNKTYIICSPQNRVETRVFQLK